MPGVRKTTARTLTSLFVGTIHAYCFRLLQRHVPRYEIYDVLDENQLTAFLSREATRLELKQLDPRNRTFALIAAFLKGVDVIENELLNPTTMPDPFGSVLRSYYETLERYRLLTYGQQIARAVTELQRPALAAEVHGKLRHLIVDEYQDVNPAQERLIRLLTGPEVELCVVGDDDEQAVYQWRGSDVSNILRFAERYPAVSAFEIATNRRSRPQIIDVANGFARSLPDRIEKTMGHHRAHSSDGRPEVVVWRAESELEEAGWIASLIFDLADAGARYRDIAVLVRGRASYPRLVEQFASFDIPVQPGGRSGVFDQPEAVLLGHTITWLTEIEWRDRYGPGRLIDEAALLADYQRMFKLSDARRNLVARFLREWKQAVPRENRVADLLSELYELLVELDVPGSSSSSAARTSLQWSATVVRCPLTSSSQAGRRPDTLVATSLPWALRPGRGSSPPMSTSSTRAPSARRCTSTTPTRSYCSSSPGRRRCAVQTGRSSCRPARWSPSLGARQVPIAWSTAPTRPFATSWSPRPIAPTSSSTPTQARCSSSSPSSAWPIRTAPTRTKSPSSPKRCGRRLTEPPDLAEGAATALTGRARRTSSVTTGSAAAYSTCAPTASVRRAATRALPRLMLMRRGDRRLQPRITR